MLAAVLVEVEEGAVHQAHVCGGRDHAQLERHQQAQRAVAPRERAEEVGVLSVACDAKDFAVRGHQLVGLDRVVHEPRHVRVGGHADGQHQPAQRGVLHLDGGLELQPLRVEVGGDLAGGGEGLHVHGAALAVHAQDGAQVPHLHLGGARLVRGACVQRSVGFAIGAQGTHRRSALARALVRVLLHLTGHTAHARIVRRRVGRVALALEALDHRVGLAERQHARDQEQLTVLLHPRFEPAVVLHGVLGRWAAESGSQRYSFFRIASRNDAGMPPRVSAATRDEKGTK